MMYKNLTDSSINAVEVARGLEAFDISQSLDTTAFFESLRLNEEGGDVVTMSAGDRVQFGSPVEINMNASTGSQRFVTMYPAENTSNNDSEENQIEVPRALGAEHSSVVNEVESPNITLTLGDQSSKSSNGTAMLENFLDNLRKDPGWARSVEYVKLAAAVRRDMQLELINHAYLNVNARPKMMIVMSTTMAAEDITECIKAILSATTAMPDLEVEYTDILGEMFNKGVKLRMKTSDVNTFLKLEHYGRTLGMRFLTTFHCRSSVNVHRTMDIRYYDEVKSSGTRVNYVHLDHEAFNNRPVKFGDVSVEASTAVDVEDITPLRLMYPPVYDLNEAIIKLHKQMHPSPMHPDSP